MSVIHRQLQTFLAIDALLTQLINGQGSGGSNSSGGSSNGGFGGILQTPSR